jgi:HAD superfamily hydrolase (TIGR01509 family)
MSARPAIKAVLFDLYETLVTERGLDVPRAGKLGPAFGIPTERFRPVWKAHRKRIVRGELTFRDALFDIGAQLNVPIDTATVDLVCEERLRAKRMVMRRVDPELAAMTRDLRQQGIPLAVVSNSMAEDVAAWHECALAHEFSTVLFSHAVGMAKPDPDIYLEAARRLGADPAEVVFVGDAAVEDLVGAQSAGLRAVCNTWFLPPGVDPPDVERVPLVSRPRELLELVSSERLR